MAKTANTHIWQVQKHRPNSLLERTTEFFGLQADLKIGWRNVQGSSFPQTEGDQT